MDIWHLFRRFQPISFSQFIFLAIVTGIGGGIGAIVFRGAIQVLLVIFYQIYPDDTVSSLIQEIPWFMVVLVPAFGGLLVGSIVYFGKLTEVKGHGVPEVMEAFVKKGGRMRLVVAPTKALLSAITIASGGATGREGPIVQIGAAIGSSLGQFFRLRPEYIKVLLASGAAAGIGATFNAPIAGVIFAWEVLFPKIKKRYIIILGIASLVGTIFANSIMNFPRGSIRSSIFEIPSFTILNGVEIGLYGVLGGLAAIVSVAYIRTLYKTEDLFEKLPLPEMLKPALGGFFVGLIALVFPQIFGFASYSTIEQTLNTAFDPGLLGILVIAKLIATSLTLGSGGSGGVFAPALFIGAMLGGSFGGGVQMLFPGLVGGSTEYAVVGIGAVFAAAAHAPFTSIIIIMELTQSWDIFIPVSIACGVSYAVIRQVGTRSVYTEKLYRKHIRTKDFH